MEKILIFILAISLTFIGVNLFSPDENSIEKVIGSKSLPEEYIAPDLKSDEVVPTLNLKTEEFISTYTDTREEPNPEINSNYTTIRNKKIKIIIISKNLIDNKCFLFEEKDKSLNIRLNNKCNFIVEKENQNFDLNNVYDIINIENKIADIEDLVIKEENGTLYLTKRD